MADYSYNPKKKGFNQQYNPPVSSSSTSNELYNSNTTNKARYPTPNTFYDREERENRLSQKVGLLKQISLDMGEEIKLGNSELEDMQSSLGETADKLKRTMDKFAYMAKRQFQGGGIYLYLLLFVLLIIGLLIIFR